MWATCVSIKTDYTTQSSEDIEVVPCMEYCHGTFFGIFYIVVNNQNHIIERKLSRMVVCLVGFSFCHNFWHFFGTRGRDKRQADVYCLHIIFGNSPVFQKSQLLLISPKKYTCTNLLITFLQISEIRTPQVLH